jgi:hypothetical protein
MRAAIAEHRVIADVTLAPTMVSSSPGTVREKDRVTTVEWRHCHIRGSRDLDAGA